MIMIVLISPIKLQVWLLALKLINFEIYFFIPRYIAKLIDEVEVNI